jgi:hypothetical protein
MAHNMRDQPRSRLEEALRKTPPTNPVISYDRYSDELLVYFSADAAKRPSVSSLLAPSVWLRVDRETGQGVGVQIEHFLALVAPQHPGLMVFLDLAELRGITVEEAAKLRHQFAKEHPNEAIYEAFDLFRHLIVPNESQRRLAARAS